MGEPFIRKKNYKEIPSQTLSKFNLELQRNLNVLCKFFMYNYLINHKKNLNMIPNH